VRTSTNSTSRCAPADGNRRAILAAIRAFLRWKGAAFVQEYDRAARMHSPEALERVRTVWRGADPLRAWLDAHVWPSGTPAR
jgi:prophage maintenance system killer protein